MNEAIEELKSFYSEAVQNHQNGNYSAAENLYIF